MANVIINDEHLSDIAEAIREKNGLTNTYKPSEMAEAIVAIPVGGGELPEEALVITGQCQYRFSNGGWDWFIEEFGNRVTTQNINNMSSMFLNTKVEEITFELNCLNTSVVNLSNMFQGASNLTRIPKINNCKANDLSYLFRDCRKLREIPEDIADWFDWSSIEGTTSAYSGNTSGLFNNCYSLRKVPMDMLLHVNKNIVYSYAPLAGAFTNCYALDELINIPLPYISAWTSNIFTNTFLSCLRLKNITFQLNEDGSPITMQWKNQTIDLSKNIGWATSYSSVVGYNSGITKDKEVKDDAGYQALKNDPDWFTSDLAYSRYNHDSAVATINSLPDTSAYGTNTIKFKGNAGEKTDGGAINTLTEEEIAVATAKGWTVTFA